MTHKDIVKVLLSVLLFGLVVWMTAIEISYFSNMVRPARLFAIGGIGSLIGATIIFIKSRQWARSLFEKFILGMGIFILSLIIFPILTSMINRYFGEKKSTETPYDLIEIKPRKEVISGVVDSISLKRYGYRITVMDEGKQNSFYAKRRRSFRIVDDKVYLPMKTGLLGLMYMDEDNHE